MRKTNFRSFLQTVREKLKFNYDSWLLHVEFKTLYLGNKGADVTFARLVFASSCSRGKPKSSSGKVREVLS